MSGRLDAIGRAARNRRSSARRVSFSLAAFGALSAATVYLHQQAPGLWAFLVLSLIGALGEAGSVIAATRALAGTAPEQRGKQSDDLALARAQRSLGCLPLLVAGILLPTLLFGVVRGRWMIEGFVVFLAGVVGHLAGVALIAWVRRQHPA